MEKKNNILADQNVLSSLLPNNIDAFKLLSNISFRINFNTTQSHYSFPIPTHPTSYGHNKTLH